MIRIRLDPLAPVNACLDSICLEVAYGALGALAYASKVRWRSDTQWLESKAPEAMRTCPHRRSQRASQRRKAIDNLTLLPCLQLPRAHCLANQSRPAGQLPPAALQERHMCMTAHCATQRADRALRVRRRVVVVVGGCAVTCHK